MKEWTDILKVAVELIVVAVFIIAVVVLVNRGKTLLNKGTDMLNDGTNALLDFDVTQYEDTSVSGSQVIDLVKKYWQADNVIAITVCTKDGGNIMYDYSDTIYQMRASLLGFPSADAKKNTLDPNNLLFVKKGGASSGLPNIDDSVGYKEDPSKGLGYINKVSGIFRGKVQYDSNDTPRCITFVQQ